MSDVTGGTDGTDGTDEDHLRRVYGIEDPTEIRDYYDGWAKSYDAELRANGYASPKRVAVALASVATDLNLPVLDYGCGTGMSGEELASAGFAAIDGADPSEQMLAVADAKGIYRSLTHLDIAADHPPFDKGSYAGVAAVGLIGPGAAPLPLFDQLADLVAPAGLFGFSFNDHAMDDPAYPGKIAEFTQGGPFEVAFEEHGPHLPGLEVGSMVYVLRRSSD